MNDLQQILDGLDITSEIITYERPPDVASKYVYVAKCNYFIAMAWLVILEFPSPTKNDFFLFNNNPGSAISYQTLRCDSIVNCLDYINIDNIVKCLADGRARLTMRLVNEK